ncbi:MAG: hypothetical protein AAB495_01815 [Patescibacteria group bacterium]
MKKKIDYLISYLIMRPSGFFAEMTVDPKRPDVTAFLIEEIPFSFESEQPKLQEPERWTPAAYAAWRSAIIEVNRIIEEANRLLAEKDDEIAPSRVSNPILRLVVGGNATLTISKGIGGILPTLPLPTGPLPQPA